MKKIFIVGATSSIAQAFCKNSLQREKHEFYLVGRSSDKLNSIAKDLKVRGATKVYTEVLDLNQFESLEKVVQRANESLKGMDWALVAHGILGNQRSAENKLNETLEIINSNFTSQAIIINFIASLMEINKKGVIGVLSSVAGDRGRCSNYIYGSAKSAMNCYLSGLRVRLFKSKVQVLTIKMGFVDTPMTAQFKKGVLWSRPEKIAPTLVSLFENKKNGEIYLPSFWCYIMFVIRNIPSFIFNKLDFL